MSIYKLEIFQPDLYDKWNDFVEKSNNGTIFHRLDFLDYHGSKFKSEEHHLIWYKGDTIFAVMPMAIFKDRGSIVAKSPYGASFGGIVYLKKIKLRHAIYLVRSLTEYLTNLGVDKIFLTLPPSIYQLVFTNYLEYVLSANNFDIISKDIFSIIKLSDNYENVRNNYEGRARTIINKYEKEFEIVNNVNPEDFYPILIEDKMRHNNAKPTHTLEDLRWLKNKFPKEIIFDIAIHKKTKARAGICYFRVRENVMMTFYMAQENLAKGLNGVNVLVNDGIKKAISTGIEYFDFGASSLGYTIENIGVAEFKESFGAKGFCRNTFKWERTK